MLYIILLLVVLFIGWSYISARTRRHHANKSRAMRKLASMDERGAMEAVSYPSWVSNGNRRDEFLAMIFADAKRKNIPETFVLGMMSTKEGRDKLMFIAGMMEEGRSSFEEQGMAASDMIIMSWSKIPHAQKQYFINGK